MTIRKALGCRELDGCWTHIRSENEGWNSTQTHRFGEVGLDALHRGHPLHLGRLGGLRGLVIARQVWQTLNLRQMTHVVKEYLEPCLQTKTAVYIHGHALCALFHTNLALQRL